MYGIINGIISSLQNLMGILHNLDAKFWLEILDWYVGFIKFAVESWSTYPSNSEHSYKFFNNWVHNGF